MPWTPDTITHLRALWEEGHSTAEIGRRLGVSKYAVTGKVHRIGLPARPSPTQAPAAHPVRDRPRRVPAGVSTLPPLGSVG